MGSIFLDVLNMSYIASYVIICVLVIRLMLKGAPKIISYSLWSVVAFRLVIPFSFESVMSIVPKGINAKPIPSDIVYQQTPQINTGIGSVDNFVSGSLPGASIEGSINPLQIYEFFGTIIWVVGICVIVGYSIISFIKLKNQLKEARYLEKNIYEVGKLETPFVFGIIKPLIYLPSDLGEEEKRYIIRHEEIHIERKDYLVKIFAFVLLAIYWFNPLVWVAFVLMNSDMEFSCDERVLKEVGGDIKKMYATSLLSLATEKSVYKSSPIAFGEGNVKSRIKNVLQYKKPKFWIVIVSIIVVIILGVGLMSNPVRQDGNSRYEVALMSNPVRQDDSSRYEVAQKWAEALGNRDGKARYDLMTKNLQESYYKDLVDKNGERNPWNIGVSSPYVVSYEIEQKEDSVVITYITETSVPEEYIYQEELYFVRKNGKEYVSDYKVHVNYLKKQLYELAKEIQSAVDEGREASRLIPEDVVNSFIFDGLGITDGKIVSNKDNRYVFRRENGEEIEVTLYRPIRNDSTGFWAIYEYTTINGTFLMNNEYILPEYNRPKESEEFIFDSTDEVIKDMEKYMNMDYPLIAKLESENIYLYEDINNPKLILVKDGDLQYLEFGYFGYVTPRGILPQIFYDDYDNDGVDELLIDIYAASGTGVSIEEIHIVEVNNNSEAYSYRNEEYVSEVLERFSFEINSDKQFATINVDGKEHIINVFEKTSDVVFGAIAYFEVDGNDIYLSVELGVKDPDWVSPSYIDERIRFDVKYNNGKFELENPQFMKSKYN